MRWVRPVAIVISILLVVILILGFVAPKEYSIVLSEQIDTPRSLVFKKVGSFEAMLEWMPLKRLDPTAQFEFEGTGGTVGSSMSWRGNEKVGSGSRTIKAITPLILVEMYYRFSEPWEAISNSNIKLDQIDDGTLLTWTYVGKNPFPFNILQMFFRYDQELSLEFQNSLDELKESCENEYLIEKYKGYTIEPFAWSERYYLGITDTLVIDSLQTFYESKFAQIDTLLDRNLVEKGGPKCGLFYTKDAESKLVIVTAAYPVAKGVQLDSLQSLTIKADSALRINHYGDPSNLVDAHLALNTYMNDNELSYQIPFIEEYVTEAQTSPDTVKEQVRVIYLLKPKVVAPNESER